MLTPSEMKDRMHELARKKGYIDSIFNYCDRWCERCAFTSKCRNYEFGKDAPAPDGPELWEYLDNVLKAAMLMLDEMMKKMVIDPREIDKMELPEEFDPKDHPLYEKTYDLSSSMRDWLEQNKPGEIMIDDLEIISAEKEKNSRFYDAIEVIYFYNFFISAKIYRALIDSDDPEPDEIQTDSNGSAKIALIALDRMIASWSIILENMMDREDKILKFLINLAEIRKQTEIIFPGARKFVRPGFDE
jgi:hypothetical protein